MSTSRAFVKVANHALKEGAGDHHELALWVIVPPDHENALAHRNLLQESGQGLNSTTEGS